MQDYCEKLVVALIDCFGDHAPDVALKIANEEWAARSASYEMRRIVVSMMLDALQ